MNSAAPGTETGPETSAATPTAAERAATRRARKRRDLIVATVVIVLSIGVVAWLLSLTPAAPTQAASPSEFERLSPGVAAAMLRQDGVGVDLPSGMWCALTIDDIGIPDQQLSTVNKASGECLFRPGKDKVITEFAPGAHVATIRYFTVERPDDAKTFTMPFTVR